MGYDPSRPVPFAIPDDEPTRPRTMRRAIVQSAVCPKCLGTGVVNTYQWFGQQPCDECEGSGHSDE